jgi:RNA-binding protein
MKVLGTVQEISCDGRMIVRGDITPPPRAKVVDNRKNTLGKVRRIFGPVDSPYISVDTTDEISLMGMIGKQVYFEGVDNNGKGKRRHRRD